MKAERVGAVGRARGEDAPEPLAPVPSRMDLEDVAMTLVKPSDDEQLVANLYAAQSGHCPGLHLEPGGGSAFRPLPRSVVAVLEGRADDADGAKGKADSSFGFHASFL